MKKQIDRSAAYSHKAGGLFHPQSAKRPDRKIQENAADHGGIEYRDGVHKAEIRRYENRNKKHKRKFALEKTQGAQTPSVLTRLQYGGNHAVADRYDRSGYMCNGVRNFFLLEAVFLYHKEKIGANGLLWKVECDMMAIQI